MTHIRLDPVGGMAGDMFAAAMLDAFPTLEPFVQRAVREAGLPERFQCRLVSHKDHALTGKRFLVLEAGHPAPAQSPAGHAHPSSSSSSSSPSSSSASSPSHHHAPDHAHGHRSFAEIRSNLEEAPLDAGVRTHALAIFTSLAEAEAQVHGATPDTVTFHELGEWDSIADIVAAAAIISSLGPATWAVGPLPLGDELVKSAHGLLPVPAPATALLLRGLAVRDDGIGGERVTPTGAAIARHLASLPGGAQGELTMAGVGLGFGTRVLPGISNCLRVLSFETGKEGSGRVSEQITVIEFEVDDQTPEDLALGLDRIRAHPEVLDLLQTASFGKKGRVAISVRVLCRRGGEEEVTDLCFRETTTLGLRLLDVRRHTLARSRRTVTVEGRSVDLKRARRDRLTSAKVEAESLRDLAGHEERERLRRAAEEA